MFLALAVGCFESWTLLDGSGTAEDKAPADTAADFDLDHDGYNSVESGGDDCWDDPASTPDVFETLNDFSPLQAAEVFPGATDRWYDGVDQDCRNDDDFDQDGDGFATMAWTEVRTTLPLTDCYDALTEVYPELWPECVVLADRVIALPLGPEAIHPGAADTAYDGSDANCDAASDFDADGDSFDSCGECDDADPEKFPNEAAEDWYNGIDENCDGNDADQDGDGYLAFGYDEGSGVPHVGKLPGDCWDDPTAGGTNFSAINGFNALEAGDVHPDATDTWYDAVDQDCAGDGDFDQDGDGQLTDGYADRDGAAGDDCDDLNGEIYAGAPETFYDGIDSDCNGLSDFDQDWDGHEAEASGGDDCDDTKASVNPDQIEECSTTYDDNCDGDVNDVDAYDCVEFHGDNDNDGYGGGTPLCLCEPFGDYSATNAEDCDDTDGSVSPATMEDCATEGDDDCDGSVNQADAAGCTEFFADEDGDGYGTSEAGCFCAALEEFSAGVANDCDDAAAAVNPAASEVCDDADQDCDGEVDESPECTVDSDGDGAADWREAAWGTDPQSADSDGDGLSDGEEASFGADPLNADTDADGVADGVEAELGFDPLDADSDDDGSDDYTEIAADFTWYADTDGDGFGNPNASVLSATLPAGYANDPSDCDDANAGINPGAVEVWYNGTDEDCAGDGDYDQDADGYQSDAHGGDDCVDTDPARFPGSTSWEVPGDAATIQQAIDAACTLDAIQVAAGNYVENIEFGAKLLDLVGEGVDSTTVTGASYTPVVTMAGGSIEGFTIRGGTSTGDGGGIRIEGASSAFLSNLYVIDNFAAGDGGGIAIIDSGEVLISDCEIAGNEAGGSGGGISFSGGTSAVVGLQLDNVAILGNEAPGAGGVLYDGLAPLTLTASDLSENNNYGGSSVLSVTGELTWAGGSLTGNPANTLSVTGFAELSDLTVSANAGGMTIDGDLLATDIEISGVTSNSSPAVWVTGHAEVVGLSLIGNTGTAMLSVEGGFDLSRIDIRDSRVAAEGAALELTGSGTANHVLIAGVQVGSGIELVPVDATDFQKIDHITVVDTDQYGVRLSAVGHYQFELGHVLIEDSTYTGLYGNGFRVGLNWANLDGGSGAGYGGVDLSTADLATVMDVSPGFISYNTEMPVWAWDLHLSPTSALVDIDSTALDADGTPADIGAYGGSLADAGWYTDVDRDGLPDGWETEHGLDTTTDDTSGDLDGDGLSNVAELIAGTLPDDADTDNDHAPDSESEPLSAVLREDAEFYYPGGSQFYLASFCAVGDLDNDGADNLAIDIAYYHNSDRAYYEYFVDNPAAGDQVMNTGSSGPIYSGEGIYCSNLAGDLNNDGFDDVAVRYAGYLILAKGPMANSTSLSGKTWVYAYGYPNPVSADFDADGIDDIAVGNGSYTGTYTYEGAVYLFTEVAVALDAGSSLAETDASTKIVGDATYDWFGGTVAMGDFNGDGNADLLATDSYTAHIFHGPISPSGTVSSTSASVIPDSDPAFYYSYSSSASVGGDMDGDGVDELVVGHSVAGGASELFALSNPADGMVFSDAEQVIGGGARSITNSTVKPGDWNGDGFGDLYVCASDVDDYDTILVFSGSAVLPAVRTTDDADRALFDGGASAQFGSTFQVGDFDGDDRSDIAAETGTTTGYPGVEIFFGSGFY